MKIRKLARRTCPRTGGTWFVYLAGPDQGRSYSLEDYTRPRKLTKPQRAERRRRRRQLQHDEAQLFQPADWLPVLQYLDAIDSLTHLCKTHEYGPRLPHAQHLYD